jgi:DNA-directed RNA polymerase specialized sigma24 family protein
VALLQSTTPSRIAAHRERSEVLREALASLPDELRDVVRLRLFEDLTCEQVAERLGLGVSAVKHRFRKGGALYRERLAHLASEPRGRPLPSGDGSERPGSRRFPLGGGSGVLPTG